MKRHPYITALAIGLVVFLVQLLLTGAPQFTGLNSKSHALAAQALSRLAASPSAISWLLLYFSIGIAAHVAPLAFITKVMRDLQQRAPSPVRAVARQRGAIILSMLLILMLMVTWNRWLFPTEAAATYESTWPTWVPAAIALILTLAALALLMTWLATSATRHTICILTISSCFALFAGTNWTQPAMDRNQGRPDIIILGVDSLRPDHLTAFGDPHSAAPYIDTFVANSLNFVRAYTPQGRTFVAYMSLLSGQYPVNNEVRENLYPRDLFNHNRLLSHTLHKNGYTTIFSLDEGRFANIDESFGFDHVLTPPAGVVEIVAGTMYDTAGTNLLQLVPGAWRLLPHVAGNRALKVSYRPSIQTTRIIDTIDNADPDKPIFLVAHFCIAHVPFALGPWPDEHLSIEYDDSPAPYRKAISIADRQLATTMEALRRSGRLQNAIVIMLSDHGEGLDMKKDEWKLADGKKKQLNLPLDFGHGTAALNDSQSHVLFAIQRFRAGKPVWPASRVKDAISLIDIAPTVLKLADVDRAGHSFDGIPIVDHDANILAPKQRPIFIESGISGRSLQTANVDDEAVANEFNYLFEISPDLRFELIAEKIPEQLAFKQRAVVLGGYGVASMPRATAGGCWLVVDYKARIRDCFDRAADDPIARSYGKLICDHFIKDSEFHHEWCTDKLTRRSEPLVVD